MNDLVILLLVVYFVWLLYMMTFRLDTLIRIFKAHDARQTEQSERIGKAMKGAVTLFRRLRGR
jgi:hypothetical protein